MSALSKFDHFYELTHDCAVDHSKIKDYRGMPIAHYHNDYEFYFLNSGNRKYFASNRIYDIRPNQIVIFKPNITHQVIANLEISYERYLVFATPKLIDSILLENPQIKLNGETQLFNLSKKSFDSSIRYIKKIDNEIRYGDKYSPSAIKSIFTELLIHIFRNGEVSTLLIEKKDKGIQSAIDYILKNYANPITISDCAKAAYMSPSHFSREFHKTTSLTFKEFLNKTRVDASLELLKKPEVSVSQVAQSVGFSSESYFGYVFKQMQETSPLQYKKASEKSHSKQIIK